MDEFKIINDTYGHDCGDFVLKEVSKILLEYTSNKKGWVARYGGDEFLLVFEMLVEAEANDIASSLKKIIYDNDIYYNNNKINVSCSIGVHYSLII
ncbi:MAG: GGDEF domain-containing protein [Peptostreptococcaceae bacterium]